MSAAAIAAAKKKKRKVLRVLLPRCPQPPIDPRSTHQPVLGLQSAAFASDAQPVVGTLMVVEGNITVDGVEKPLRERDVLIKWLRMPMEVEVGLGGKTYTPVPQDLGCTLRVVVSIPSQPFTTDLTCTSKPVKLPQV